MEEYHTVVRRYDEDVFKEFYYLTDSDEWSLEAKIKAGYLDGEDYIQTPIQIESITFSTIADGAFGFRWGFLEALVNRYGFDEVGREKMGRMLYYNIETLKELRHITYKGVPRNCNVREGKCRHYICGYLSCCYLCSMDRDIQSKMDLLFEPTMVKSAGSYIH